MRPSPAFLPCLFLVGVPCVSGSCSRGSCVGPSLTGPAHTHVQLLVVTGLHTPSVDLVMKSFFGYNHLVLTTTEI